MPNSPLMIFCLNAKPLPLRNLLKTLIEGGYPAGIGVGIAGEAADEDLDDANWEAAIIRWNEPELHEIYLIDRLPRSDDEDAEEIISEMQKLVAQSSDTTGRLIVESHLSRAVVVYTINLLPALPIDDDHLGWEALDIILRQIAKVNDGLIYAETEGFCDADGELILSEIEDEPHLDEEMDNEELN